MNYSGPAAFSHVALAFALALALTAPARADSNDDRPLVSIDLPADPNSPAIATLTMAGRNYRMAVDTAAGDLFFHLPVAQRDLQPAANDPSRAQKANGLYGDVDLQYFQGEAFTVGSWKVQTPGVVLAVDLGQIVQDYGIDGVLGVPYLSELSWHWDRRAYKLLGYRHNAQAVAAIRARMQCSQLFEVDAFPAVTLNVGPERVPFIIDTGFMDVSGGLNAQDHDALAYRGAVRDAAAADGYTDIAGRSLPTLRKTQIQNVSLGSTRLDGLVFSEIKRDSRLGIGFLGKFDESLFDFGTGKFCTPAVDHVDPDSLAPWQPN